MAAHNFDFVQTDGAPLKMWTRGVPVEDAAMQQLRNVASIPFVHKHVAAMPDVHWGKGATVGSVIATKGAIIPAAVGCDIGCGMCAAMTDLTASDLPDSLAGIRSAIEAAVPHGRTDNGGANDRGAWGTTPVKVLGVMLGGSDPNSLNARLIRLAEKHPKLKRSATVRSVISARSAQATTSSRSAWTKSSASG
jgi:tRNA-splicing ligase RtcB